jgi:hypothetical protein
MMRFWTQFRLVYELTSGMMSNKFQIRDLGQAHWKSYRSGAGEGLAMKRSWNWAVWTGASLVFLGVVSYPLFFVRFPGLRDFPWANLPMIALGLVLLALGLVRAFQHPDRCRGKIFGSVLAVLALAFSGFFLYGIFIGARHVLPASHDAPRVGQTAPDFTLPDSQNHPVSLTGALNSPFTPESATGAEKGAAQAAGVVLIFYRGYW